VKLVCISDTHSRHRHLMVGSETRLRSGPLPPDIPDGDVMIHAGDCTSSGTISQLEDLAEWFGSYPHKYKILIAGNHDYCFEREPERSREICKKEGIIYLQDESVTIDGVLFYGSPWTPTFRNMAFNANEEKMAEFRAQIPDLVEVLITHGPALRIFDWVPRDAEHAGCYPLAKRIDELSSLKAHICGHIHAGYGFATREIDAVKFVNAASCTERYQPTNPPIVINI